MNFKEAEYHGTKRELKEYLEGLQYAALRRLAITYETERKVVRNKYLESEGFNHWAEHNLPTVLANLKPLDSALHKLRTKDVRSYSNMPGMSFMHNLDNSERVRESMVSYFDISSMDEVKLINHEEENARASLKKEWAKVINGILGRKDRILQTCQLVEDAGIDLTEYYELVAKKRNDRLPVPSINVKALGLGSKEDK